MEDKVLEMMGSYKRLPDYVLLRKYHHIYFFEMPMPQRVIQELINALTSADECDKFSGILLDPFNSQDRRTVKFLNEIPEVTKESGCDEKEITWAYNIGSFKGGNWEIYYEFNSELLLVGIEGNKNNFDESLRGNSTLMDYHYSLSDLLNYFESVATSNDRIPLDIESVDFLNKLKLNYSQYASSIKV